MLGKEKRRYRYYNTKTKRVLFDPVWMSRLPAPRFEDEVIARLDKEKGNTNEAGEQWKNIGIDLSFLTKRQAEILGLIADGLTYQQVADLLDLTDGTIKKHMLQIRKKVVKNNGIIQLSLFQGDSAEKVENRD